MQGFLFIFFLRYRGRHFTGGLYVRHAHHLASDVVRFLFVLIIGGAHGQLGLDTDNLALWSEALRLNELCHALIAQLTLELEDGGGERTWGHAGRNGL